MPSKFATYFSDFKNAANQLNNYIETNNNSLLASGDYYKTVSRLMKESLEHLNKLKSARLPSEQKIACDTMRKNWGNYKKYLENSIDLGKNLHSPESAFDVKKCQMAMNRLQKDLPLEDRVSIKRNIDQSSLKKLAEDFFKKQAFKRIEAGELDASINNLSTYVSSIKSTKDQPLSRFVLKIQDLEDHIIFAFSREESRRLSDTFIRIYPWIVETLNLVLNHHYIKEEDLNTFSESIFDRNRLIMLCLIKSAKDNDQNFLKVLPQNNAEQFKDFSKKINEINNPIHAFLEDELDESVLEELFNLVQHVKFLTEDFIFDNPSQENLEKETQLFSAFMQGGLKERFFPKETQVKTVSTILRNFFLFKRGRWTNEEKKQFFSGIIELFTYDAYKEAVDLLKILTMSQGSPDYFCEIVDAFRQNGQYESLRTFLLGIDSICLSLSNMDKILTKIIEVRDWELFAHIIVVAEKNSQNVIKNRLPSYVSQMTPDFCLAAINSLREKGIESIALALQSAQDNAERDNLLRDVRVFYYLMHSTRV